MFKLVNEINKRDRLMVAPLMGFPGLQLVNASIKTAQQNHLIHFKVINALYQKFQPDIVLPMMDLSLEANALGRETKFPVNEPAAILKQNFTEIDFLQMQDIDINKDARIRSYCDTIKMLSDNLPKHAVKAAYITGPFTLAALIKGADETAIATMITPDLLHELIEFCKDTVLKFTNALIASGAQLICILEPTASLLNPDSFTEFSGKYISEIAQHCRMQNTYSVLHICGNTMPFIKSLANTNVDGLSLDSIEAGVDLSAAAQVIPDDITLIGNICPTGKILSGKPIDVAQEVRELKEEMKLHPNFILSTGCDLPQNVPLENIDAYMREGKKK